MDGRRYHNRRYHKWMADVRVPSDDWRLSVLAPSWAPDDWRLSAPSWARSIGEGVVGEAARSASGIEMYISGIEIDMTDISGIEDSDGARSPIPRRGGGRGLPSPKLGVLTPIPRRGGGKGLPTPKLGVPPPKLGVLIGASTESEDDEAVRSPIPIEPR
jgi:hypothetical protein